MPDCDAQPTSGLAGGGVLQPPEPALPPLAPALPLVPPLPAEPLVLLDPLAPVVPPVLDEPLAPVEPLVATTPLPPELDELPALALVPPALVPLAALFEPASPFIAPPLSLDCEPHAGAKLSRHALPATTSKR
jgi:hypothetical protein